MSFPDGPDPLHSPARLDALQATGLLDTPPEPALDRLTRLAARLTGAPVALLTLVDADRQVVKSAHGLPAALAGLREIPRSHCLCVTVVERGAALVVEDARADAEFADNGAVREWGMRAYAGVPLAGEDGHVLGVLSVADVVARPWDAADLAALADVAVLGAAEIARRRQRAERERVERDLRASERFSHVLLDASPDCVKLLDLDGRLEQMNGPGQALMEVDACGLPVGADWADFWPGEGGALARGAVREALAGGVGRFEGFCPTMRGTPKWWDVSVTPVRDAAGAIVRLLCVSRDVTAARLAEAHLRESEERFRQLAENTRDVFYFTDANDARLLFVSRAYETLWGRSCESLYAAPASWLEAVHPDDRARMTRARGGTAPYEPDVEYRIVRPDGSVRWVRDRTFVIHDASGAAYRRGGVAQDVTEQREGEERLRASERHFRALIEHASDVVSVLDAEGVTRYASPTHERLVGYAPEELVGTRSFGRIHPDDVPRVAEALRQVVSTPGGEVAVRYRYRRKDGGWRTLSSIATNLLADPAVNGIVVNSHDVTEQEALAAQLRQAQKMEAVGRLAGGVAHDFNNLLTVITASTRFAREGLPAGLPAHADLAEVEAAAGRAVALTRQLLAFSRRQVLRPQVVELNQVAAGMERLLRRMIGADVTLASDLAPALPAVHADPGQLEQVLMNLAVNARDAMPHGGTLTVQTRAHTVDAAEAARHPGLLPGAYVALCVRDTGVGMDDATQAQAFEPFFTTKEAGHGTGLGLATVYGIVKQSGGHVQVESAPGAGSTFTVLLPPVAGVQAAPAPSAEPRPAAGRETVLLVEDDAAVRTLVHRMLQRGGYTVLEAHHGAAALDVLAREGERVALVLTDAVMPEMGARGLLAVLRERHPGVPALVMSGYSADAVAMQGALAEGVALLSKPFTIDVLLARVREVLDAGPQRPAVDALGAAAPAA